jgi:hypothetical protein
VICFLASLAMLIGGFGLGHVTALHPEDTRTFLERVRANISRAFHKEPKP